MSQAGPPTWLAELDAALAALPALAAAPLAERAAGYERLERQLRAVLDQPEPAAEPAG